MSDRRAIEHLLNLMRTSLDASKLGKVLGTLSEARGLLRVGQPLARHPLEVCKLQLK
jgi:hypothetical protein